MPPAKKPPARRARAAKSSSSPATRREVQQATARFEKALDDATSALQTMRRDLGNNARTAYKDVAAALRTLRTDARKTNRSVTSTADQPVSRKATTASTFTVGSRNRRPCSVGSKR